MRKRMRGEITMSAAGLEGVVATQSGISSIIDGVLTYRGINIDELAKYASFEEVVFLLWNDKLPSNEELAKLRKDLAQQGLLPDEVILLMKALPKNTHPMAMLRTVVSALEMYDPDANDMSDEANRRKALNIQAKISTVVAAIQRVKEGKEILSPQPEFSFAQNFLYMLNGEEPHGACD